MSPSATPKSAHVTTRLICALLALAFIAALVAKIVMSLRTGQVPTLGNLVDDAAGLMAAYIFGLCAIKGPAISESGVLSEPSEKVKNLAIRTDSKVEAIKAYREQTGVEFKRAREIVERLGCSGRPEA